MSFIDIIALQIQLAEDEKALIQIVHSWLNAYNRHMGVHMPAPQGTLFELWAMISMVRILYGHGDLFPLQQVRAEVPAPHDFLARLEALTHQRLSSIALSGTMCS